MSGPRTLFRRIVFFCFSRVFLFFGSGSFYLLLGPPKTQKPRGKPKKLNLKNKKKQRILRNVWAKDFVQRHCFFCCFLVFLEFFLGFWFWKLSSATRIAKNQKTKGTLKQNTVFSGMSGLRTFFKGIVLFVCFSFFGGFAFFLFFFCFGSRPPPPPENKPILLQTLLPMNLFLIGFLLCLMFRVSVAKKSTNQGYEG